MRVDKHEKPKPTHNGWFVVCARRAKEPIRVFSSCFSVFFFAFEYVKCVLQAVGVPNIAYGHHSADIKTAIPHGSRTNTSSRARFEYRGRKVFFFYSFIFILENDVYYYMVGVLLLW